MVKVRRQFIFIRAESSAQCWDGVILYSELEKSKLNQILHFIYFFNSNQIVRFDPHATQFITFNQMSDFIASLDPPLGIPKPNTLAIVSFDLPIAKGDKIHCLDVLHSLTKYTLGFVDDETEEFAKLSEQMDEKFKKQFPTRKELEIVSSTREWKRLDTAARVIQKFYRLHIRQRAQADTDERIDSETQTRREVDRPRDDSPR